jgi:hypothetical protein
VVRKPGGTVVNPQAAVAGQPATITNPGCSISFRAESNLKMACYYLRYHRRISRATVPANITLANIRTLKSLKEWEATHTDAEPPTIEAKDWPKTFEKLEAYFRGCLGTTKIPLLYVIRETIEVKPEAQDPETINLSEQDQMIA